MSRYCNDEVRGVYDCARVAGVYNGRVAGCNTLCFELGDILIALVLLFVCGGICGKSNHHRGS